MRKLWCRFYQRTFLREPVASKVLRKILKKHDKRTNFLLKPVFMARFKMQPLELPAFDKVIVRISKVYTYLKDANGACSTLEDVNQKGRLVESQWIRCRVSFSLSLSVGCLLVETAGCVVVLLGFVAHTNTHAAHSRPRTKE